MFSAFKKFGKLGALASSVARAWSPLSLWPDGILSPGMWISPRTLTSEWQDYTGTTPVAVPGTVADSANPVGLALDIRAGATVLTDPGNHMLQSTSAARPLMSARVNLLTKTEDFADAAWVKTGSTVVANSGVAPDGSNTASKYTPDNGTTGETNSITQMPFSNGIRTGSVYVKSDFRYVGVGPFYQTNYDFRYPIFDLVTGALVSSGQHWISSSITPDLNGFWKITFTIDGVDPAFMSMRILATFDGTFAGRTSVVGDGIKSIYIWHPQIEFGSTATDYQAVLGDGSTYATGFPIAQLYDGVDDGMATAAFTAGTLIDGMDCMIAVRLDSAASVILGLSDIARGRWFAYADSGSGSVCFDPAVGAPTVWVDNIQLTGGTAVARDTLNKALTVGDWHILEFQNLNMSGYDKLRFGDYPGLVFNGARGDILLYPSTASTEDKDAARQYLADYYGVTLP